MRRSYSDSDSNSSEDETTTSFKRGKRSKKRKDEFPAVAEDQLDTCGPPPRILDPRLENNNRTYALRSPQDDDVAVTASASGKNPFRGNCNGIRSIPCPVIVNKKFIEYGDKKSPSNDSAIGVSPSPPTDTASDIKSKFNLPNGRPGSFDYSDKGEEVTFRSSAAEIMKKMGFNPDIGLGRTIDDCEISSTVLEEIDRSLEAANINPDEEGLDFDERISLDENIQWIKPVFPVHPVDAQSLSEWRKVGPRKSSVREETIFIRKNLLKNVLTLKECFNQLNQHQYVSVRSRANPFEGLGRGPFLSRAGLKMANLDAALSGAITNPSGAAGDKQSLVGPNELFYFADICGGPGGFSEYILHRKKWESKGFGMTLKGALDFDLWSSSIANAENFEAYYGPNKDGNIYNPVNTTAFINYVRMSTDGRGVQLMMADGGFDIENKELQEILSSQIYLSQCYLALALVRTGGIFVCKLFDALTPFTIGLIYLMYLSFDLVAIHKPNSSRPANSERYLICKWKKAESDGILEYLGTCHDIYWKLKLHNDTSHGKEEDILELVPLKILQGNQEFFNYIFESNNGIAKRQVRCLKRMVLFSRDCKLRDPRQSDIRQKLLESWKVPPAGIVNNGVPISAERAFNELFGVTKKADFLSSPEYFLQEINLETYIKSPYDWRSVVVGAPQDERNRGTYMAMGRDRVYRYDNGKWTRVVDERLELTKDTLVYGEFVDEINGKGSTQRTVRAFHIIDALILGGVDVRMKHYTARLEVCIKFAKSMNKPSSPGVCAVRAKIPVRMENIEDIFDRLENRTIAGKGTAGHLLCPVDHTDETLPFINPAGILFLKITKDPWTMALSKSSNKKYFFNIQTGQSSYEFVEASISEFDYTMQNRLIWTWNKGLKSILSTQDVTDFKTPVATPPGALNPHRLLHHIKGAWQDKTVMRRLSSSSSQGSI